MTVDATTLRTTATALLGVLTDAADAIPWAPASEVVTATRPGFDCDSIYAWPDRVRVTRAGGNNPGKCVSIITVTYRYAIAVCIGTDAKEDAAWWAARATLIDRIWGVLADLVVSADDGSLCAALNIGKDCSDVWVGDAQRFDSADLFVWEGDVNVVLPVVTVGS